MNRIFILIFMILLYKGATMNVKGQSEPAFQKPVRLKITDSKSTPLYGVHIIDKKKSFLITATDDEGICLFDASGYDLRDSIRFNSLGFLDQTLTIEKLLGKQQLVMEENVLPLDEVTIIGIKPEALLKKAAQPLEKRLKYRYLRYYGNGQYEKITSCRGGAVEYRREYGCFFTPGNVDRTDQFDTYGSCCFIPAYIARSYNLTPDGQDTLYPLYNYGIAQKSIGYDAGARKIFDLMRAIQLYGPLFSGVKYYDFQPVETDETDYTFIFQTKPSAYPEKIRINGRGTVIIDKERQQVKKIIFDYIDYHYYRLTKKHQGRANSPFSSRIEIEFAYADDYQCYVKTAILETRWKYTEDNRFYAVEWPSRRNAAHNNLVEQEAFYCESYNNLDTKWHTESFNIVMSRAAVNPEGEYNPEVFRKLPELLDSRKAFTDLNRYKNIESQFKHFSRKAYYPDEYLMGYGNVNTVYNDEYFKDFKKARKYALMYFKQE